MMLAAARNLVAWAFLPGLLWMLRGHRLDSGPD
jgi:hypothetical protein